MTFPIRTRKIKTFAPLRCYVCKREIVIGERYEDRQAWERHEGCEA